MIHAEDQIRIRAYYLWEAEGRPHGRHLLHWFAAAEQIGREDRAIAGTADEANVATQALPAAADEPALVTDGTTVPAKRLRATRTPPVAAVAEAPAGSKVVPVKAGARPKASLRATAASATRKPRAAKPEVPLH